MSSRKNLIIPVFIPYRGCPNQCVFCNQKRITGQPDAPAPQEVVKFLEEHLSENTAHAVIAFYGGSFTGIPLTEQKAYLQAVQPFIQKGFAAGIKMSTRPDYVYEKHMDFLRGYGVRGIELGAQSMDDGVLKASGRGHTAADTVNAAAVIRAAGMELGIQLMAGLPGDTPETFIKSVNRVAILRPDFVRIYPTLVIIGSPLEESWKSGEYVSLGLDEAVQLCTEAVRVFNAEGIPIARMGLQPSRELEESLLAGPYHPAFGHLVSSALAMEKMLAILTDNESGGVEFLVNPAELSVFKGIRGENIRKFGFITGGMKVRISPDPEVPKGALRFRTL
jgi:histone acetyltransferase (RNA polymerase elongator complex component)